MSACWLEADSDRRCHTRLGIITIICLLRAVNAAKVEAVDRDERHEHQALIYGIDSSGDHVSISDNSQAAPLNGISLMRSESGSYAETDGQNARSVPPEMSLADYNQHWSVSKQVPGCTYNDWQPWTTCSKSCGGGMHSRTRPAATANCQQYSEDADCNTQGCAVDCKWKDWGGWSICSMTCGSGVTTRVRIEDLRENGGKQCTGVGMESQACTNNNGCAGAVTTTATATTTIGPNERATAVTGIITLTATNATKFAVDDTVVPALIYAITELASVNEAEVKVGLQMAHAGANVELWFTVEVKCSLPDCTVASSNLHANTLAAALKAKSPAEVASAIQNELQKHSFAYAISVASVALDISYSPDTPHPTPIPTMPPHPAVSRNIVSGTADEETSVPTPAPSGSPRCCTSSMLLSLLLLMLTGLTDATYSADEY